jgi:hypothetical protein
MPKQERSRKKKWKEKEKQREINKKTCKFTQENLEKHIVAMYNKQS